MANTNLAKFDVVCNRLIDTNEYVRFERFCEGALKRAGSIIPDSGDIFIAGYYLDKCSILKEFAKFKARCYEVAEAYVKTILGGENKFERAKNITEATFEAEVGEYSNLGIFSTANFYELAESHKYKKQLKEGERLSVYSFRDTKEYARYLFLEQLSLMAKKLLRVKAEWEKETAREAQMADSENNANPVGADALDRPLDEEQKEVDTFVPEPTASTVGDGENNANPVGATTEGSPLDEAQEEVNTFVPEPTASTVGDGVSTSRMDEEQEEVNTFVPEPTASTVGATTEGSPQNVEMENQQTADSVETIIDVQTTEQTIDPEPIETTNNSSSLPQQPTDDETPEQLQTTENGIPRAVEASAPTIGDTTSEPTHKPETPTDYPIIAPLNTELPLGIAERSQILADRDRDEILRGGTYGFLKLIEAMKRLPSVINLREAVEGCLSHQRQGEGGNFEQYIDGLVLTPKQGLKELSLKRDKEVARFLRITTKGQPLAKLKAQADLVNKVYMCKSERTKRTYPDNRSGIPFFVTEYSDMDEYIELGILFVINRAYGDIIESRKIQESER